MCIVLIDIFLTKFSISITNYLNKKKEAPEFTLRLLFKFIDFTDVILCPGSPGSFPGSRTVFQYNRRFFLLRTSYQNPCLNLHDQLLFSIPYAIFPVHERCKHLFLSILNLLILTSIQNTDHEIQISHISQPHQIRHQQDPRFFRQSAKLRQTTVNQIP